MNDNTKIEVAREIMNAMIANACINGFDKNNKEILLLLSEEQKMEAFDFNIIDKIINHYSLLVKRRV